VPDEKPPSPANRVLRAPFRDEYRRVRAVLSALNWAAVGRVSSRGCLHAFRKSRVVAGHCSGVPSPSVDLLGVRELSEGALVVVGGLSCSGAKNEPQQCAQ